MLNRATPVVKNLIIINALVFLAQNAMPVLEKTFIGHYPLSPGFQPWQVISYMFMHGSLTHLFFNMFAVFMFGSQLERVWGSKRFLQFYMLTGIGAFFIFQLTVGLELYNIYGVLSLDQDIGLVLGASGSVFGLLLGFGMLFPNTQLMLLFPPIPIKAKYFVLGYGLIELSMAFSNNPGDNVAHLAHLGGMLIGFILIKKWQNSRSNFY